MMGLSKEKTKLLMRLKSPRFRPREGLFLVEGVRGAGEVLEADLPFEISFALVSPRLAQIGGGEALRARLAHGGAPVLEVSDSEMALFAETESPQGVLLVVSELADPWENLEAHPSPRVLILDGVQDPGNVGTLIRGARAFGLAGVLALEGTADPWNPKAVRAAAGAYAHVPVARAPWPQVLTWLRERGIPLLAADAGGEDVGGIRPGASWALAVGNEGAGPREGVLEAAETVVAIPMAAGVDSLNAGVAGAVLLYALSSHETKEGEA